MIILLEPTNAVETFRDKQFRLFVGKTKSGIDVQMLGMFRILNAEDRAKFVAELIHHVQHQAPVVTAALDAPALITGAEEAQMRRREIAARAIEAAFVQGVGQPAGSGPREGSWSNFLSLGDELLKKLGEVR